MKTLVIHPKDRTTDFLKPIYEGRDFTVITGGCTKADVHEAIKAHDHIIMMGHGTPQGLLSVGQFSGKPKPKTVQTTPLAPSKAVGTPGKAVTKKDIKAYYAGGGKTISGSLLDQLPDRFDEEEDDWFTSRKVGGGYSSYGNTTYGTYPSYESLTTGYVIDDSSAEFLRGKKLTAIWCNADQYMEWNNLSGFYTGMFISDTSEAKMIGTSDTEQWQVDESNYMFSFIMRELVNYPAEQIIVHAKNKYSKLAERNAVAKYNLLRLYQREAEAELKQAVHND